MDRKGTGMLRRSGRARRPELAGLGKAASAVIAVIGTLTATLFLLVDHGVFGSNGDDSQQPDVVNVAVRDLRAPLLGGGEWSGESQLGNLVADAYRHATKTKLAFVNSRGLRANILAGEVSSAQLAAVVPFHNQLVTMQLTGAQVWALLAQQFPNNQILQVSGLRFSYRPTGAGTGVIQAVDELPPADGPRPVPNDGSKLYSAVVDSFLADGGDGFTVLTRGINRVATSIEAAAALTDYVHSLTRPFDSGAQGRIVRTDH
jgi:5'-nucleotidase